MIHDSTHLQLSDFDLFPERGFLPYPDPLTRFPCHSAFFSPLEEMANDLPKLLGGRLFRQRLDEISHDVLAQPACCDHASSIINSYVRGNPAVLKRAKLIFDYLGQAYIWAIADPLSYVPEGFAEFWYLISKKRGMRPILSYDHYALNNWRRFDLAKPIELGNIAMLQNFLAGLDEDWFVLVHVDIEAKANQIPSAIIEGMQSVFRQDSAQLESCLATIASSLQNIYATLLRMPESCDPYIYYERVRPYIHGWKNNPALPQGILYKGVHAYQNRPQQFRGESGAQSAIVPSLVVALDIRHTESAFTPYLKDMLNYMPKGHRKFVKTIGRLSRMGCSIRNFVVERKNSHPTLYDTYCSCRQWLYKFREKHYEYVGRYIHAQAQRHTGNPTAVGTAGTPFMVALKQLLNETWFE